VESTDKGVLFPGLTDVQMRGISSPANGLMVYCTNCCQDGAGAPYYYDGDWKSLVSNCEAPPPPSCFDVVISRFNTTHILLQFFEYLVDGITTEDEQGDEVNTNNLRLHKDSQDHLIIFSFPEDVPIGYSIKVYFNTKDSPATGNLGLNIRPLKSALDTGQNALTTAALPAGSTLVDLGDNDFVYTRELSALIDSVVVEGSTTRDHVIFLEFQVFDADGVQVPLECL
jgi:hypothetical protein